MSMRPLDDDLVKITTKWATTGDVEDPEDNNITRTEGWGTVYSDVGGKRPEREVVNQRFAEWDALALEFVRHGVVRWDERVDYSHPALVMGNDDTLYESVGSSGPGSANATNPVTDIVFTYWQPLIRVASPPNASETVRGIIQIATSTEAAARTNALKAVPAAYVAAAVPAADTGTEGKVELATNPESRLGADGSRAMTPAGVAYTLQAGLQQWRVGSANVATTASKTTPEILNITGVDGDGNAIIGTGTDLPVLAIENITVAGGQKVFISGGIDGLRLHAANAAASFSAGDDLYLADDFDGFQTSSTDGIKVGVVLGGSAVTGLYDVVIDLWSSFLGEGDLSGTVYRYTTSGTHTLTWTNAQTSALVVIRSGDGGGGGGGGGGGARVNNVAGGVGGVGVVGASGGVSRVRRGVNTLITIGGGVGGTGGLRGARGDEFAPPGAPNFNSDIGLGGAGGAGGVGGDSTYSNNVGDGGDGGGGAKGGVGQTNVGLITLASNDALTILVGAGGAGGAGGVGGAGGGGTGNPGIAGTAGTAGTVGGWVVIIPLNTGQLVTN